ncbi:hypothetical protein ABGV43_17915 [Paenibacillus amylolyticus]|uniref:hypothetical protein n=1 Tax=Paenibacillus TaxID=44249 RepID=UPI00286A3DD4|nr:hypothetical protein [Paenibacillus sp. 2003]
MIRRYIADKELKVKRYIVGQRGQTPVSLLYLEMGFMPGHISIPYTRKHRPTGGKNYPEHISMWLSLYNSYDEIWFLRYTMDC